MLKRVSVTFLVASVLLAATPALADSPFDGTWKIDEAAAKIDPKPIVLSLRKGTWRCSTCEPAYTLAADGKFHPVKRDYVDSQRIVILSPRSVRSETRRQGKLLGAVTWTVARDGKSMDAVWWNVDNAQGKRLTGTSHYTRLGSQPRGLNAINGSWRQDSVANQQAEALTMSIKLDGDALSLRQPTGERADVVLGGPKAKIVGDPTDSYVSAKRIEADTIELTAYLGDRVVGTQTLHLNADGSMKMTGRSPSGLVNENTARRH